MSEDAPPIGPILQGLDTLWDRWKSGWRRLLSPRVVAELEMRASFDVDLMAPWRIANKVPPGAIPDCPSCENICCVGVENVVSLRLRDVALLMDLRRTDLISKKKPNFPRAMLATRPALFELVGSELFRTLPVLRQVGELRACAALTPDLRCSLHPAWPTSCERFPYTLAAKRREVHWGKRCAYRTAGPEHEARARQLFHASIAAYNERVRDAVLLTHAREELDGLGIGAWLTATNEDPFEERPVGLPIVD